MASASALALAATPALLAVERATLLKVRRHLERQLRVLQVEERALLRWEPGMPLPTPDSLPEEEEANAEEEWGGAWEDAWAGEEAYPDDARMDEVQASPTATDAPPTERQPQTQPASASSWEDHLMGQLEEDSPWLAEMPPQVLRMG